MRKFDHHDHSRHLADLLAQAVRLLGDALEASPSLHAEFDAGERVPYTGLLPYLRLPQES